MKLSFYFDINPWDTENSLIYAYANVVSLNEKNPGTIRYRIDVEIPDPKSPDVIITGEAKEIE